MDRLRRVPAVIVLATTSAGVVLVSGFYLGPSLVRLREIGRLHRRARARRVLTLTYDDGPGAQTTPRVLEVLRAHQARATFFPLGRRAEARPETLDAVAASGHEIGCHSHAHQHAWKTLPWTAALDAHHGYRTLSRWVAPDGIFRPPYGKLNLGSWLAVRRRGAALGWWSIDSGDTHASLPRPKDIVDQVRRAGGGVVLMHDHDPERAGQADFMVNTTGQLLELAQREQLAVMPLGDLLGLELKPVHDAAV